MIKKSTTFGIEPENLRSLFNIGKDASKEDVKKGDNQKKNEILHSLLRQTLPLEKNQMDMLPAALGKLCHTIGLLAGETIFDLLQNPSTDISIIDRIKKYSKELSANTESKINHDAATAIYYAAIAHALVFHDQKITKFSYKKLETSFSRLVKEKWITRDLSVLFKIACKYSKEKSTS